MGIKSYRFRLGLRSGHELDHESEFCIFFGQIFLCVYPFTKYTLTICNKKKIHVN